MLAHMLLPFDEELYLTWLIRSCGSNGSVVVQLLNYYSTNNSILRHLPLAYPVNSNTLVESMRRLEIPVSKADFIRRHSCYFFFKNLLSGKYRTSLLRAVWDPKGIGDLGALSLRNKYCQLQYCPVCATEEYNSFQQVFIKRSHLLPTQFACLNHKVELISLSSIHALTMAKALTKGEVTPCKNDFLIFCSAMSEELVKGNIRLTYSKIMAIDQLQKDTKATTTLRQLLGPKTALLDEISRLDSPHKTLAPCLTAIRRFLTLASAAYTNSLPVPLHRFNRPVQNVETFPPQDSNEAMNSNKNKPRKARDARKSKTFLPTPDAKQIGERIRELRQKCGMTSERLADSIGVFKNQISKYENGRTIPSVVSLCKLANVFGTSTDYLINGI